MKGGREEKREVMNVEVTNIINTLKVVTFLMFFFFLISMSSAEFVNLITDD